MSGIGDFWGSPFADVKNYLLQTTYCPSTGKILKSVSPLADVKYYLLQTTNCKRAQQICLGCGEDVYRISGCRTSSLAEFQLYSCDPFNNKTKCLKINICNITKGCPPGSRPTFELQAL